MEGDEMEEGEVTEDGELSDIRYVVTLPSLPHFSSAMTPVWRRVRLARKRRRKNQHSRMHLMTELVITTDVALM